MMKNLAS